MKKYLSFTFLLLVLFIHQINAQKKELALAGVSDSLPKVEAAKADTTPPPTMFGWRVDPRSGERISAEVNKELYNYHQSSLVEGNSLAVSYLGNLGSPAQTKMFSELPDQSLFPFLDAFSFYHKTPEDHVFLNTKQPYSNVTYQSGGGRLNKEEQLNTTLSFNFGKKINFGFNFDYLYSRGFYAYLSNRQISYDIFGSYISDRYQMNMFISNNNYNNSENGGITDIRYITDPTNPDFTSSDTKEISVNIQNLWNKLKGRHIFISNKYDVGYDKNNAESDQKTFVPVASFTLTTHYTDQVRRFASKDDVITDLKNNTTNTDAQFDTIYYDPNVPANDEMAYWSFKNTFAISLNEGFRNWVKFGLTAYIEQDFRKFSLPSASLPIPFIVDTYSQSATNIGGILNKQKGRYLRYNLGAEFGVLGNDLGQMKLTGDVSSTIKFAGKDAVVSAKAYIKNLTPEFFQDQFRSKYIVWDKNLNDVNRVYIGGEIKLPQTNTRLSGGVENITNHIYYGEDAIIAQENRSVQVLSLRLDQNLNAGILHWDNQIAYQTTSDERVIPLPTVSFYSNLYLLTKIAKVMTVQLGVDARYHTRYYAPGYSPVTLQFYNQRESKVGDFPISTAYANIHLKKTRFFVMFYNIASGMGNSESFTVPNYPLNPMVFKFGISWDFDN